MLLQYCLYAASLSSFALAGTLSSSFVQHLQLRQSDYDPDDLSGIKNLAAIGDSYSAGIGAGERLGGLLDPGAWACSRYNDSHPNLVNNHPFLGDPANRKFQFESCSGALTNQIKDDQVPRIDAGQDVILLSASGNDAGLVDILNQCVFQFFSPSDILAFLAKKTRIGLALEGFGIDLAKYSRSCDAQLDFSEGLINDAAFSNNIVQLIDAAKAKLKPDGTLYYTGYAKFWDEAASNDDWCSKPENTWSISLRKASNAIQDATGIQDWQPTAILTADRRKRMNSLVDLVNSKISAAVAAAGDQVVFVNFDEYVGDIGGRYCAPGVQEPQKTRWNLGFYELDVGDPLGTSPFKRSGATLPTGTFEGDINLAAELAFTAGDQYKDDALAPSINGHQPDRRASFIPDGYGRIFHPTIIGHTVMAELLVWNMQKRQDARAGFSDFAEPDGNIGYDQCPLPPAQKSPTCDMDKVSGVPYNVFDDGKGNTIYGNFCNNLRGLDPAVNYQETVDAHGNQKSTSKLKFSKRTPPPNPDAFDKYSFKLGWVPNKNSNQCTTDCKGAFSSMVDSPCGHTGGESNALTNQAVLDIGCGFYSWEITAPEKPVDPGYATGTCCFHLNEWEEACKDSGSNLFADVNLVDNDKKTIYTTSDKDKVDGLGIDINDPKGGGNFQGPLPHPVHMTGEHQNDYIQFSYNGLSWTSGDKTGSATCSTGGWDPRSGSQCPGGSPFDGDKINAKRQMDCCFPC